MIRSFIRIAEKYKSNYNIKKVFNDILLRAYLKKLRVIKTGNYLNSKKVFTCFLCKGFSSFVESFFAVS